MGSFAVALMALAFAGTISAQRSSDRDDSSFVITSINRGRPSGSGTDRRDSGSSDRRDSVGSDRRDSVSSDRRDSVGSDRRDSVGSDRRDSGSFNGRDSDRFGGSSSSSRLTGSGSRPSSSRGQFPDFVRIEVEIQRLDNPTGIIANGKKCDTFKSCDPRLTAYLDIGKPLSPWPGSVPEKKWPIIFEVSNQNSPTIGKSLNVDVCGGSVNKINARVHAVEMDSLTGNDEMNNFECLFDVDPRDIALDAGSARWGPSTECRSSAQPGKIRLFARQRAYEIPSTSCRASASS
ncbi:hypothetical protein BV898_01092 [Hypsibius exemplaris]|uniref:Secreted protein n=1 Tax=Hypsibius exemplaris TaxID=2072580 RepID=A0A1W0XD54_HYPEX|nr:hypothetical protein BV898_01092 [Hypsibius exemplaris]